MANIVYYRVLNPNYITIQGTNLVRLGLFNKSTKVYLMDPTVFSADGIYLQPTMDANQVVFSTDFTQAKTKNTFAAWTAAGWTPSNIATFVAQLKTFADANLPFTLPSYNLVIGEVVYEQPEVFTFRNDDLLDYTYNSTTGLVSYEGAPDLSAVAVGNLFRDSLGAYFRVTAKDNLNKTVTIVDQVTSLPPAAIAASVSVPRDGAIYSDIGGSVTNYAMAFFYPGNQGTLIP